MSDYGRRRNREKIIECINGQKTQYGKDLCHALLHGFAEKLFIEYRYDSGGFSGYSKFGTKLPLAVHFIKYMAIHFSILLSIQILP